MKYRWKKYLTQERSLRIRRIVLNSIKLLFYWDVRYLWEIEHYFYTERFYHFSCRGEIVRIEDDQIFCVVYKDRECSDSRQIIIDRSDFTNMPKEKGWFELTQYFDKPQVSMFPQRRYSKEDADKEYDELMKILPESI